MSTSEPWTTSDLEQMERRRISPTEVQRQLEVFRRPAPVTRLERPCLLDEGILRISEEDSQELIGEWRQLATAERLSKFVPASGAATRMFRELREALEVLTDDSGGPDGTDSSLLQRLVNVLPDFPFWPRFQSVIGSQEASFEARSGSQNLADLLTRLLDPSGLGLTGLPKGLIDFHLYESGPRSAFEEHLIEGSTYLATAGGVCRYHFTVSADHLDDFEQALVEAAPRVEQQTGMDLEVSFSIQSPSTDTLAVDLENRPFRLANGELLFRPAGHGSLIENLQHFGGDIVFIKNIDNVAPERQHQISGHWKRLLAGKLGQLQREIFGLVGRLESACTEQLVEEALDFLGSRLSIQPSGPALETGLLKRRETLLDLLARPLRICGVVRNEGQPGGGPFWVKDPERGISRQIVESAQVDHEDADQMQIWRSSTHFNPTDLVCGLRDRNGALYDLSRFVDPEMSFISKKSHAGRPLRALERPGLWNGAMAGWNTVFVEVPLSTFTPVKTVFDLLEAEHRT